MNWGVSLELVGYTWYIEGPKENIIVDAGGTAEGLIKYGVPTETIHSVEDGLSMVGLKPDDIDIVILTHLHFDHVELGYKYTKARFIVQKAELDFARNPHPIAAGEYDKDTFERLNYEVIEGDKEVTEGVRILVTPGHTPGGQSILVETAKGTAVITGFCCIDDNFYPPDEVAKRMPVIISAFHTDIYQFYDSMLKVKGIADIIVPIHEKKFLNIDRIP